MSNISLEDTAYFRFDTVTYSTGALTNADSTPTIDIQEDGGAAATMGATVANVTTGEYKATVAVTAANGFEAGKRYNVMVHYAVATVNQSQQIAEFQCLATPTAEGTPKVEVSTLVSAAVTTIASGVFATVLEVSSTFGDLVRGAMSILAGKVTNFTTGTLVFKSLDGTKTRWTVTTDETGRLTSTKGDLT